MAAPRYDPSGHPLLSPAACQLDSVTLREQAVAAELALGLVPGPTLQGDAADQATIAVVRQINLQIRMGVDGDLAAESKGDQSFTYVTDEDGRRLAIDRIAAMIVERLIGVPTRPESVNLAFTW